MHVSGNGKGRPASDPSHLVWRVDCVEAAVIPDRGRLRAARFQLGAYVCVLYGHGRPFVASVLVTASTEVRQT